MTTLLDTSVLVAAERGRDIRELADEPWAISAITLAELHMGVLSATPATAGARLETLVQVEQLFNPLPVDAFVARRWAQLMADCSARGERPQVMDALIAATALVHGIPLLTLDRGFGVFEGLDVIFA